MATKRSRRTKDGAKPGGRLLRRIFLDPDVRRKSLRWLAIGAAACVIAFGVHLGFDRLGRTVHGQAKYERRLILRWEDPPDWLLVPDNRHILDDLTRRAGLLDTDRLLDPQLAERMGKALSDPQAGWIESVDRVAMRPDGVVSVRCHFRRPAAWVRHGRCCYLVDKSGVRLPGRYEASDCIGSLLMTIDGVALGPPDVGQVWRGGDLACGLKVAALLGRQPFRHQIAGISVANHDGRRDRNRPHLELVTDRDGSRIWWGRPPDEEFGTEIRASQKVTLLETMYRQFGRIDMNRSYVNIMTWPDRIAMPAAHADSSAPKRLVRG